MEELELPAETIAVLRDNKEMTTRCLQKAWKGKLYAAFNTWRAKWAMKKLIASIEEDSSDDEPETVHLIDLKLTRAANQKNSKGK